MNYIFDFIGTLVGDNPKQYRGLLSKTFGLTLEDYNERVRQFISTHDFSSKEEALDKLLGKIGIPLSNEEKKGFFRGFEEWKLNIIVYPDTLETLRELKKKSKIGVISNNSAFTEDLVERDGILEYVDSLILSHKVGYMKPDERIYHLCLKELGVSPEQVTMVGDQLEKDVLFPISLGMRGILFDPDNKYSNYSGKKIRRLSELV